MNGSIGRSFYVYLREIENFKETKKIIRVFAEIVKYLPSAITCTRFELVTFNELFGREEIRFLWAIHKAREGVSGGGWKVERPKMWTLKDIRRSFGSSDNLREEMSRIRAGGATIWS